ncbi:hypothetical protein AB3G33_08195 [Flavobacterium sp. WC2421]|uniref:Uncharacterized protein n=3 Tax=unclassified Flavobacterium TaxID=196869 RepID=A0AB39WCF3_9FLAO
MKTKSINRINKYDTLFLYIGTFFVAIAGLSGILMAIYLSIQLTESF